MADKPTAPPASATKAKPVVSAKKPAEPKYEVVFNESGAMVRRPISATKPAAPAPAPAPAPGSAAAGPAAAGAPAPAPVPRELEEIVFDESGEELTGEARAKALAEAQAKIQAEEVVFDESGEEVTGEARAKVQAEAEARAKAQAEAKAKTEKLTKKQKKDLEEFNAANNVEKMRLFYRYRGRNPYFFTYTNEGNLQIKPNNPAKLPATTIPMRAFSALKPEELAEIERIQKEKQKELEISYVVKLKQLRDEVEIHDPEDKTSISNVVRLNQELRQISILRNRALYPERWVHDVENPTTSDILLNLPHEERKLGFDAYLFKRNPLSREDADGKYREHGAVGGSTQEGGGTLVLFITNVDDQQTGHFHPAFEREFVFNETKYISPYQAYEVERFKEFEDDEMVDKLLGTRSAKTIRQLASQDPRQPKFPVNLWEDILEAYYSQFKDASDKLKDTGSARFHMMDKQTASPDYAVALANVRTKLKERESDAPANIDAIKQSVITEAEQKKAKVGAIINNFRRHG